MRKMTIAITAAVLLGGATAAFTQSGLRNIQETLTGDQEAPAVISTTGHGSFKARINQDETAIAYTLSFDALEGDVWHAHIHLGHEQNNGSIVLWLCQTALYVSPSPSTPQCFDPLNLASARSNTVSGVLTAADVVPVPSSGIGSNEFSEVIALIRAGKAYVNVHSSRFPPGEIRSQIGNHPH